MICLLQRVRFGAVTINNQIEGQIPPGLVVLCAFQPHDNSETLAKMAHKLLHYRVFNDANNKTNLNVQQIEGDLLLVPQFTLAADTKKGLRPSFHTAATPALAENLFSQFCQIIEQSYKPPQTGQLGADMLVEIHNDGPMTFWLEN